MIFEVTCWDREIVRIVFVIDANDREVVAWKAVAGARVSGSMMRSDAGSGGAALWRDPAATLCRMAVSPRYDARLSRLVACFTPVQCP